MMKEWIKNNKWMVLAVCAGLALFWWQRETEERYRQAKVLSEEQAKNYVVLQEEMKMEKEQSKQLAAFVEESLSGQREPERIFIYESATAQTKEQAAVEIKDRINNRDPSLPGEALEKSDRTVVAATTDETEKETGYQVGVWKVWTAPKTLAGPVIGFAPLDSGIKPDYVGYEKLWNLKGTDKPPRYLGLEAGINNLSGGDIDGAKAEVRVKLLR
jgi:hypothetical protein